mmetsp:Transcript_31903/g.66584  ORF Transcript_31903/g.66584 Transcript_31903/m.66584 type:complete len:280 (-) Transcript_31903:970-1809(-)
MNAYFFLVTVLSVMIFPSSHCFIATMRRSSKIRYHLAQRQFKSIGGNLQCRGLCPKPRQLAQRLTTYATSPEWSLELYIPEAEDMEDLGGLLATLVLGTDAEKDDTMSSSADLILLDGDLGAGKTALSRGFIQTALGDFDMPVTSPTYLLSNTYKTSETPEIQHMDLYRLTGTKPNELRPLNLKHVFDNCVALIEWPERLGEMMKEVPADRLEIYLQIIAGEGTDETISNYEDDTTEGAQMRKAILKPFGERWSQRLQSAIEDGFLDDLLEPDFPLPGK